ncbi:hypothetical protein CYMTET_37011 [Cymbomonas tetramitiformis]|uniref:RRM domain-containing protein n=1 Tax=Cymbomonas tetramitiformis TaxID=36881 RepID=A0AAE0F729_9CHLO|nr:hypothetical protein CYMTET_37011 [Cymbomonas tetramitiformis]
MKHPDRLSQDGKIAAPPPPGPPAKEGETDEEMGGPKANEESDKKDTETISQSTILHVGQLTRNVSVAHLQEIFGVYGKIKNIDLAMDRVVNLPKGFAYVEYEVRADAEKAREYMNGGQLDGNVTTCNFILVPKKSEGLKDKETERAQKFSPERSPASSSPVSASALTHSPSLAVASSPADEPASQAAGKPSAPASQSTSWWPRRSIFPQPTAEARLSPAPPFAIALSPSFAISTAPPLAHPSSPASPDVFQIFRVALSLSKAEGPQGRARCREEAGQEPLQQRQRLWFFISKVSILFKIFKVEIS